MSDKPGTWDYNNGLYSWEGGSLILPLRLADLFEILWQNFGGFVDLERIHARYFGTHDSACEKGVQTIKVQKLNLAKRLAQTEIVIASVYGRGYAMVRGDSDIAAASEAHCYKKRRRLNDADYNEMRRLWVGGISQVEIARRMGCTSQWVNQIVNG